MKILQVIQYFSPQKGGSVYSVYNLVSRLVKCGHQVTIFTTNSEFAPQFAGSLAPAEVVTFPSYFGLLRYSPQMRKALNQRIKEFDLVHLNNYWSYQNIIASHYCRKYKIPYVLSPHGSLPIMMRGFMRKYLYDRLFGNNILKNAARIIAVSEMEYQQILARKTPANKIRIIPNAVDPSIGKLSVKGVFKRKFNVRDDERIILFLGRIHSIKGVDLLIDAFANLVKVISGVKLVIAGPDEDYLVEVQRQVSDLNIKDKVIFTGPLYNEDKYNAFNDADIYVLPSQYEIFAISVLEACAFGVPVIITENIGIVNFIKGIAGEVVPFRMERLLEALERLLKDDNLRQQYGQNGKKMVEDIFSWDKVIRDYEQIYQEVVAGAKK